MSRFTQPHIPFVGRVFACAAATCLFFLPPLPLCAGREGLVEADSVASTGDKAFRHWVLDRFSDYYARGVDEKLYLQLDKPYYCAGDTIWFKGYLVNAVSHIPKPLSNYIYVELTGPADTLVCRYKIKVDEYGFHNCIALDARMTPGYYSLRAYSRWMLNGGPGHFFTKALRIVNPLDDRFQADASYEKLDDGTVRAVLSFSSDAGPLKGRAVRCDISSAGQLFHSRGRTDADGKAGVVFTPAAGGSTLTVEVDINGQVTRRAIIRLPDYTDDYDLQFFPEGGSLLAGRLQRVAFKAVGAAGLSVEVAGGIFNGGGEQVADIATSHNGMGVTAMAALPGERYYAVVRSAGGLEKRFDLPGSVDAGYALTAIPMRESIIYDVLHAGGAPSGGLALVVHCHGRVVAVEDCRAGQPGIIHTSGLPEGVAHIVLVDKELMQPLSQRLVYVRGGAKDAVDVEITADKPSYGKREKACLTIGLHGADTVRGGVFAVSVTDMGSVRPDSAAADIRSYLLLESDLKGYIEDPGGYFADDSPATAAKMDILLMTQGWTRFDISDILAGRLAGYACEHESSQSIGGRVTGLSGKAAAGASLTVMAPRIRYMDKHFLAPTGRFILDGLSFPDSTVFMLQASGRTGLSRTLSIEVDSESFPQPSAALPPLWPGKPEAAIPELFRTRSRIRLGLEDGVRVVNFEDITVAAPKKSDEVTIMGGQAHPARIVTAADIDRQYAAMTVKEMLYQIWPRSRSVSLYLMGLYLDDMMIMPDVSTEGLDPEEEDMEDQLKERSILGRTPVEWVESLYVMAGLEALTFLPHPDTVHDPKEMLAVFINMKRTDGSFRVDMPSRAIVAPLGFKKPVQFYQPRYDAPLAGGQPDVRATLLWDPRLKPDGNGEMGASFFTSDSEEGYYVQLEGITGSGKVCRAALVVNGR